MSSNDDYLQYIIIDELQRLMKTKNSDDICIIMTHNKHFYLNVKYGWHYKPFNNQDKKVACFIRLMPDGNHSVIQYIDKKSEDFKTSYESLWKDLIFLYNNDDAPADLLLNSIRRIIETFLKFNAIESSEFYGNMPGVEKYFNVNSHSVDDLEAELNGKGKSEIMALMREYFEKNNLLPHFEHYFSKAL
ncbi:AAA family ATPase [Megasphaera sp.]|uniref:AAA family ATPase n=1 Tax=Megasphaera sp. TaxID=2023260 RepID=UPI00307B029A